MASYTPPTANLPTFDPTVFRQITDALTIEDGDLRYLRFPTGQGSEYIPSLTVGSTLSAGASTLTSVITNTTTGTAVGTAVSLYGEATRTGGISIGTGNTSTSLAIQIGNQTGAVGSVEIGTTTITVGRSNCATNSIQTSTSGTLNLKSSVSSSGAINMGTGMTSGTIDIGTSNSSTTAISIGSGSGEKTIVIGQAGTTTSSLTRLRAYQIELNPAVSGILNLGTFMTSGTIEIGTANSSTTAINIGNGTGNKSITIGNVNPTSGDTFIRGFTVAINPNLTTGTLNLGQAMTAGSIVIGGTTGGTTTLTLNRPITPAYLPSAASANTIIGYKADIAGLVLAANYPIATGNITTSAFTIPIGVWVVNVVVKVNFASALSVPPAALVFLRLSLSTASGTTQDARTIDFNPNDDGNNFLNYTTTIAASAATSYYLVGASGGTPNPTITSASTSVNITRIA